MRAVPEIEPCGGGLATGSNWGHLFLGRLLCSALLFAAPLAAQSSPDGLSSALVMVGTENREDDLPSLAAAPDGSLWLAWLAYSDGRDDIALRHYVDGTLGQPAIRPQHQR